MASEMTTTILSFRSNERHFFSSLLPTDINSLTLSHSYTIENLYHWGEFAFLCAGLRPAVLAYFPSLRTLAGGDDETKRVHHLMEQYVERVWDPIINSIDSLRFEKIRIPPTADVRTPHTESLSGSYIYFNTRHPDYERAKRIFTFTHHNEPIMISETDMAFTLDYPFALPENESDPNRDEFVQIAYVDENSHDVLTCFIAKKEDLESGKAMAHFRRYRDGVQDWIKLRIVVG